MTGRLSTEIRRRLRLLTPAERFWWVTFFPVGIAAALIEIVGGILVFALITKLVDSGGGGSGFGRTGWISWILRAVPGNTPLSLALAIAGLYMVKNALLFGAIHYRAHVGGAIAARLSSRIAKGYLAAPYEFYLRRNSADTCQNVLSGVPAVIRLLDSIVTLATELFVITGFLMLLMRVAARGTLVASAIVTLFVGVFVRAMRGRYHRLGARHFELSARVLRTLQQALGGIKEVRAFGREQYFGDLVVRADEARTRAFIQYTALEHIPRLLTEMAFVLGLIGLVVMTLHAEPASAVLALIGLYAYSGLRLIPAGHRLVVQAGNIRYELAASERLCQEIGEILIPPPPSCGNAAPKRPDAFQESICVENVSHWYDGRPEPALRAVDLVIEHGECLAIVGATGAGKTTLIDIILGLIQPAEGRITVDGVDIRADIAAWQRLIGYVPQDPFLVDNTLRRNIAFGIEDSDIDPAAIENAVEAAQLCDCIGRLPNGLDTEVGERGVRLSGGERKRLAIARALYRNPQLIVFDEATSSLDPGTEHALVRAIDALRVSKTVLIVAHRLATVERADRVVLLGQGRVEGNGTYADLARSNSAFRSVAALDIT